MSSVNLVETAGVLPAAWSSRSVGHVGTACVKVLRMDGSPVPEEVHAAAEVLLVLDGRLELLVEGAEFAVERGEMFRVPAGARHAVGPGSHGTLVIVEEAGGGCPYVFGQGPRPLGSCGRGRAES
ncbi:cupin domain-containing protein [Streptomyces sp. TRM66268-LWL]|uniref:Cupin domain-containing protein n=1 Tax=Streptomyces polyasparticus TaxID=2767826 RepID=A0ABR7SUE2_9ACTN|nr:cupin domain-containing protein [Streptomyces polyasparticus]MBC9718562.1 cupin domain-containing protein [Streptomyces polyasparticus]